MVKIKGQPKVNDPSKRPLTGKEIEFARQIVAGKAQTDAYRFAYLPREDSLPETIKVLAHRVAKRAHVAAEIARLRGMIDRKRLLSLNERCEILAGRILDPNTKSSDLAQLVGVYSRISGDQAPERHEVSGNDGAPIATTATVTIVPRVSQRERLAQMRAARKPRPVAA